MKRAAICAAAGAVFCVVTAAVAQDIEISSLDIKQSNTSVETNRPARLAAGYVVDVSGRQVRLVGSRFLPDNSRDVALLGRADALAREEARSQMASN